MKVNMEFNSRMTKVSEIANDSIFQELEFDELNGIKSGEIAKNIYYFNKLGVRVRQVRIILEESGIRLKSGVTSYLKGEILRKGKNKGLGILEGNRSDWPAYFGSGEIFLKPSYGFFTFLELEDEEVIINKSAVCACEESIFVEEEEFSQNNSEEVKLTGSGIVVLELPVPENEVFRCKLYNETLKTNGNIVILRSFGINHSKENSALADEKEEGLINVYRGIGDIWLVPTDKLYRDMANVLEEYYEK